MAEQVKRGEVYWLIYGEDDALKQARRPVIIVSNDKGNENAPHVMYVPITTSMKYGAIHPVVDSTGRRSWVMCEQIQSVSKDRLADYVCTLSEQEMESVERGMRISLSLFESDPEDDEEEKRELEEEIESLRSRLKTRDDDKLSVIVERDMWKKMYEIAMDKLASSNVKKDAVVPVYEAKVDEPKPKKPEIVEEPAKLVEEKLVEINTCTEADLRNIGCTLTMIHNIIEKRPYKAVTDLKVVPGITRVAYQIIEKKVCCVPVKKPAKVGPVKVAEKMVEVTAEKVNVNTATVEEMMRVAGLGKRLAEHIRAHRNKRGKFETLEDLLKVDIFGPRCMVKYGGKLTV